MKLKKIFLAGYINSMNAQNINCKSIATHINKNHFKVFSMKLADKKCVLINGVSLFSCFRPFRISIPFAMIWGLIHCDIAYFPKHLDTPNWILRFARFLNRPVFTTIEMNMCDLGKENLIDNFGGPNNLLTHFNLISNIYGISQFIIDNANCGVCLNKKILSLGVDLKVYRPKLKIKLNDIIFIGSLSERKRVFEVLKLAHTFPEITFHIVGDGPEFNKLKNSATINVIFYGQLNPIEISNLLEDIDLLFLPSKSEGFPKVILEAAASAVPSIVYSDYGATEWIYNGVNGFVADNFNDVIEIVNILLSKENLLKSCSRESISLASKFSWETRIKEWESEINNILNA